MEIEVQVSTVVGRWREDLDQCVGHVDVEHGGHESDLDADRRTKLPQTDQERDVPEVEFSIGSPQPEAAVGVDNGADPVEPVQVL